MTLPPKLNLSWGGRLDGLQWKSFHRQQNTIHQSFGQHLQKKSQLHFLLNLYFKNEVLTDFFNSSVIHIHLVIIRGKSLRMS